MGPYWPLWRLEEQGELRMGPCYHTDQYLHPLPGNNTLPTRSDFCFSHSNNATPHSVNCDLRRHSGSALSSHELDLTVPVPVISPPQIKLSPDWVSLRKSASPLYLTCPPVSDQSQCQSPPVSSLGPGQWILFPHLGSPGLTLTSGFILFKISFNYFFFTILPILMIHSIWI